MTVAEETSVEERQAGVDPLEVVSHLPGVFSLALHRVACRVGRDVMERGT